MIHDKIFDLAQDPACLMALTPHHGGAWWSARREDMADTTPRNFYTNGGSWGDFTLDTDRPFVFRAAFRDPNDGTNRNWRYVFYNSAAVPIGIQWTPSNLFAIYVINAKGATQQIYVFNNAEQNYDPHTVELHYNPAGGILQTYVDGALVNTRADFIFTTSRNVPQTTYGVNISFSLTYTDTNETVFRYPNPAEYLGLIAKSNTSTLNGVFAVTPPNTVYRVVVPSMNLRGQSGAWTFLTRARKTTGLGDQFFGQGYQVYGTQATLGHTFNSNGRFTFNTGFRDTGGSLIFRSYATPEELEIYRWYDIATVVDMDAGFVAFYLDGAEVSRQTLTGAAHFDMSGDVAQYPFVLGSTQSGSRCEAEIAHAFVLNRAMSADEITAFHEEGKKT